MSNTVPLVPKESVTVVDVSLFRKTSGQLQYLALTRPDNSFAMNKFLFLRKDQQLTLSAFSASDWGGPSTDSSRSTTEYVLYLGPNIISWKSVRQKSVSRSSTEAEYKAIANATSKNIWVCNLLYEL
ncbi:uncharacterized mitochondrial protein AtMg00810-like [Rutidosis leptorrhynchoides]|uniref:uncharacterized mitochondrial protein AtMg00810-like n=1 Tax=Rutidosis leptorrhynchoides TaxID=125765 RepID=UPI003A9A03A9